MPASRRYAIIGGGILGLATAYKLLLSGAKCRVEVFEKEAREGRHQSTHNSGVLHAGLYYKPGSLKARLAVAGIRQMVAFCREHEIAHEICGKLVVAAETGEIERLKQLHERGTQNGLAGLRLLSRQEMLQVEPHVGGVLGLHVPQEGIVDYREVCARLAKELQDRGGVLRLGGKVAKIKPRGPGWILQTERDEVEADYLINCAGLYSDRMAALAGEVAPCQIVPFRGEYYRLKDESSALVRNLIYPVPDPVFPFLGVHFTRLIRGGVEAGPNAVLAAAREGYRKGQINLADLTESLGFPGLWRFLARHRKMCWDEVRRSFSKTLFCASLQKLVPEIRVSDLVPGGAGVRAQAMNPDGELVQDFALVQKPNALHVINAPSPGATASLAVADEIVQRIAQGG